MFIINTIIILFVTTISTSPSQSDNRLFVGANQKLIQFESGNTSIHLNHQIINQEIVKMKSRTKRNLTKLILMPAMMLLALIAVLMSNPSPSFAQAETCPQESPWVKVDNIKALSYEYTAPEGKEIVEVCYKAGVTVVYYDVEPPKSSKTVDSEVLNPVGNNFQDISHASFRLQNKTTPTPSPTPTEPTTFLPMLLQGECVGVASIQVDAAELKWTVTNPNNESISFTWNANNGQNGANVVPANGTVKFKTSVDGNSVSISYLLNNDPISTNAKTSVCQSDEPTPTPTEPVTTVVDPEPDQPAGGSGPSLVGTLTPAFLAGISGLGLSAGLISIIKKFRR